MAHFAQLDENNIVVQVIVVGNADTTDTNGVENEDVGIAFCQSLVPGIWIQTSRSGAIRKNFAGPGFRYDSVRDAFISPRPAHASWTLDEDTCQWQPPIPYPNDGKAYIWNETALSWDILPGNINA